MPNISRLARRFLAVLISLTFAIILPHASGSDPFSPWPAARRYTRTEAFLAPLTPLARMEPLVSGAGLSLCQISDTVYRADGSPAQGTVVILWPAFTTADGQPVAPGILTVSLGPNGEFNAGLAPNTGASPAGAYYRATYKLNDGTTNSEYWVVPATQTTTIAAIRSKLVPANQAAQFLTRDFADSNYMNLTASQTVAGAKTFASSPAVPDPVNPTDAASKAYVDANSGGSANLASPPPIGNVAPNTGAFTTLDSVPNAAAFPGADPCAKINAAIASLPSTGGAVDARGFQGTPSCAATLLIDRYVNLLFGSLRLTLNGNPGIQITTLQPPVISGAGWKYMYNSTNGNGTVLISGIAAPMIVDLASSGPQWKNLELNGNNIGTVGVLSQPNGGGGFLFEDVHVHNFVYTGIIAPGTGAFKGRIMINDNGGDGLLIGSTPTLEGDTEIANNGGNGIHTIGESSILKSPNIDKSGLNGIYVDGRVPPTTWVANTTWISPSLIKPATGNSGNFYYYSENVNCTTGSSAPAWPQTIGATVTDGSCIWVNLSTFNNNQAPVAGVASNVMLNNAVVLRSGAAAAAYGYAADNIRFEGSSVANATCSWNSITGGSVGMGSADNSYNANGLHLLNCGYTTISNLVHLGRSYSNTVTPSDGYGLILENSFDNLVSNFQSTWSTRSPVKLIRATANQLANITAICWSNSSVTGLDAYGLQIDSASAQNQITNLLLDTQCSRPNEKGLYNRGTLTYLDNYQLKPQTVLATLDDVGSATLTNAHGRQANVPVEFDVAGTPALTIDANGKTTLYGDVSLRDIPGHEYFVSKYSSIQAAITAAYNNGAVLGTVIDDRTTPYTGPGFTLYDSVTLKLAPTTYTINATVTYNNGNNNVTAGIVALPGARLIGSSTSTNHGTIVTAANGLNADLIATSTVGTGIAATAQWWHWGGFENLRVMGNGANQTAGNCFNIENMGETAFLRTIEVSGCKLDNILFTGASATPSDIANITTNSAGRYGFNFNNLSGVAVVHGLSGDSNVTSLVRLNGGQSGTLTILGFKAEEEISGQDPLITVDQTGQNGAQPSLFIVGGYTFGRAGLNDVIKYVNGTVGTTPFISVSNFYVQDYVNAVNDTVNSRTTAAVNMNKVPFYYGPTGAFFSGQAYTLDLNTFVQSPHSGNYILSEVFGTTSSNETVVAASGTSTSVSTGGIGFRMPNRTTYGQTPDLFAKMTYAFPGGISNPQQWEFIPVKVAGDNSTRWIGDPNYRWDELYATDVNTTTATVGTLNVTNCIGCGTGTRLVSGTMQGATSTLTGNSADQTIFTATLPAGTFTTGGGAHCYAKWAHPTASGAVTYKWTLGTTTWAYGSYTSASLNLAADIEVLTIASLTSQSVNLSPVIAGTAIAAGGSYGNAGSENLANADTLKLTFNAGSSDQIKGATFYCQTIQ